jgi:Reverse transcriptase (RNA-dependent DNA polymerase)
LGIPTVADRVAQEVVRRYLEPRLEPAFHADSYGYRPGKSAIDAVRQARQRCWRYDWGARSRRKSLFRQHRLELMLRAVRRHTNQPWVLLYIERWLKAPVQLEDGSVVPPMSGTPQGGGIMRSTCGWREPFLTSRSSAARMTPFVTIRAPTRRRRYEALADRFAACKLVLHPEKTKIVYCKDANRRGDFSNQSESASPRKSNALRSLAAMSWKRPNIVNREVQARFWERPGVRFLRATRHSRRFHNVRVRSAHAPRAATKRKSQDFAFGRVEDGRGSLGHLATLRFPSPLIEPDVPD